MTAKTAAVALGARAAGYCAVWHPSGRGFCTRPPHVDTRHVDHYRGKTAITQTEGHVWRS